MRVPLLFIKALAVWQQIWVSLFKLNKLTLKVIILVFQNKLANLLSLKFLEL